MKTCCACFLVFAAVQTVAAAEPDFGTLKIKPAHLYNMGRREAWDLTINSEDYILPEIKIYDIRISETKLRPNKYKMKLTHKCYEDINFDIDVEKDKTVDFDMSGHIKPKMGTLILNAELRGKPVAEPVFVNGEPAGETPFNKEIPICSDIRISEYRRWVYAEPKYKKEVKYTQIIPPPFAFGSMDISLFFSRVTSSRYSYDDSNLSYIKKESREDEINLILDFDFVGQYNLFGFGGFIGGGWIGDVGEIIFGTEAKKVFWPFKYIAIPVSLGIGGRIQWTDMDNKLIAEFIDEPQFLQEPERFFYQQRGISRINLDIIPSIDLQLLIPGPTRSSMYIGYMYRITFSSDWQFNYKIPGKFQSTGNNTSVEETTFTVPEEYNPLKNSKARILGIPGVLRFGLIYY